MGGPGWLAGILAAVMLTVAVYCAGRLVVARRTGRPTEVDADGVHVFMGVAMAGMLTAGLKFLPAGTWEAVFALGAAWFGWRLVRVRRNAQATASPWRCLHPLPHLVECGAMLYMLAVAVTVVSKSTGTGMAAMTLSATAQRFSIVALALAVFMLGYTVWLGDRVAATALAGGTTTTTGHACPPRLAPRCAALCKIAMGVTMGYMLVMLL